MKEQRGNYAKTTIAQVLRSAKYPKITLLNSRAAGDSNK